VRHFLPSSVPRESLVVERIRVVDADENGLPGRESTRPASHGRGFEARPFSRVVGRQPLVRLRDAVAFGANLGVKGNGQILLQQRDQLLKEKIDEENPG